MWITILLTHTCQLLQDVCLPVSPSSSLLSCFSLLYCFPVLTASFTPSSSQSFILFERQSSQSMVHFPHTPNIRGYIRLKPRVGTRTKSPMWVAGNQPLEPTSVASQSPASLSITSFPPVSFPLFTSQVHLLYLRTMAL